MSLVRETHARRLWCLGDGQRDTTHATLVPRPRAETPIRAVSDTRETRPVSVLPGGQNARHRERVSGASSLERDTRPLCLWSRQTHVRCLWCLGGDQRPPASLGCTSRDDSSRSQVLLSMLSSSRCSPLLRNPVWFLVLFSNRAGPFRARRSWSPRPLPGLFGPLRVSSGPHPASSGLFRPFRGAAPVGPTGPTPPLKVFQVGPRLVALGR